MMKAWLSRMGMTAVALATYGLGATEAAAQSAAGVPVGADKPAIPMQNLKGMHIYIRAGLKTHLPGQHDYPQFLADWSKLLTRHGAVVDGSLHAPTGHELDGVDVMVIYKGDAGFMDAAERATLDAFVKRGGGLVSIHDALCGPDPADMARYVGGGKKHGEVNYTLDAHVPYTVTDPADPIMKGMTNLTLYPEEAFYKLTWSLDPKVHVLATAVIEGTPSAQKGGGAGQVVPQIWTYEHRLTGGQPARAFVWMQGHEYASFADPHIQAMLLRGISWAARHPVDELIDYKQPEH